MPQFSEISGDLDYLVVVPGVAAGTAVEWPLLVTPFNARIQSVRWVPSAAVVANGATFATLSLRNRTGAGAGAAVPATRSYAATNSVAEVAELMTLSATSADLDVAAADVLTLGVVHTSTGVAIPAGLVQVKIRVR